MARLTRRGFLKVASSTALLAGTPRIITELKDHHVVHDPYKEWIKDMGDYMFVHIPKNQHLTDVEFTKSVCLVMEEGSIFMNSRIHGFVNLHAGKNTIFSGAEIDVSGLILRNRQSVMYVENLKNQYISDMVEHSCVLHNTIFKNFHTDGVGNLPVTDITSGTTLSSANSNWILRK